MGGRATLNSVAAAANVSRQTVSNVLNSPELVSQETRERVQAAIDQLGYRPHTAARQLRTARSQIIGLRLKPARGGVLDQFLHSLTAAAERHDHRIMLFAANDDEEETHAYADLIASVGVDAFVLTGTHHGDLRTRWLLDRGLPFVTFGRPWGAEDDHPWVDVDGATGTRMATDHLVHHGHRRIAFVGWPEGSEIGDDRRAGWAAGLAAAGIDARPQVSVFDGVAGGRAAAAELLDGPAPTAFVCASDSLAFGVVAELRERGLRPGADTSVIGFDDTPTAEVLGLSSVAQPITEVAAECVRHLRAVLSQEPKPTAVLLTPRLMLRST
ncbi:LacI family DNA-binding transcriptional regulator [Amycolatopsis magusensis]|uniref:LacI family DNA-binding transcriptional regulator n=1 Tax=Amycolatopsis magusensis TaxID=882444 RepID=UPI00379498FD